MCVWHYSRGKDFNRVRHPRETPRNRTARRRIAGTCEHEGGRELALAKERIAFLEKAYKEKSEALKCANQEQKKPAPPNPQKQTTAKPSNAPKWGFEPPEDLPMSQPYWDYRNAYSDHIAAMVTATVTAIPHIPLSSAISSAISTVSKAGPPPELTKGSKSKASLFFFFFF